jgi:hypothetical protein
LNSRKKAQKAQKREPACRALATEHAVQMLRYLRSARKEHGLLINFGAYKLQVRKYALSQEPFEL